VAADLRFQDQVSLVWSPAYFVDTYSLYRGAVPHVPWVFNQVCYAGSLVGAGAIDTDVPPFGTVFFYLVTGRNGCGDGTAGYGSHGFPRPTPNPCP
jgi:hypothetical protein